MKSRGFTLLEMLFALGLAATLGLVLIGVLQTSARASADLSARAELVSEASLASAVVTARIREAVHVYPTGSTLRLSVSGFTSRRPTGGQTWTVGTDPILALILPPRDASVDCHPAYRSEGCYAFYAYYPVKRSVLTANAALGNNPGADATNDGTAWVLMEYRSYYPSPPDFTAVPVSFQPTGVGLIVCDFLDSSVSPFARTGDGVEVTIALARRVSGKVVRVTPLRTSAFPRNVAR
ncbi:PulJ/GspJ family protein [Deinococcus yavapaiensis]|uniref:Prepilin-type N-terminal cleavage/methylation domain-containing protein n=1 Tax=Deinococcus yavapaiensis KR-236 TaxID=694435 RepID=A0A318S8J4_9DEIO|nr:type II secretion system protein [Deinococcus yavapaiensis]PYE54435.1 hypothetical protein DES52_10572 [Deinococcus yavapaiensis KR-236]